MNGFPPIDLDFGKTYNYRAYAINRVGTGYGNVLSVKKGCELPPTSLTGFASDDKSITASVTFSNYNSYISCTTNHKVKLDLVASYDQSLVFQTVTLSASSAGVSYTFNNNLDVCTFYAVRASHYSDEVSGVIFINSLFLKIRNRNISFSTPQGSFINSDTYQVYGSVSGDLIPQGGGASLIVATIFSSVNPNLNIGSYEYFVAGTNMTIDSSRFKRGQKNYVRFMAYSDLCQDTPTLNYRTEIQHYSEVHEFTPPAPVCQFATWSSTLRQSTSQLIVDNINDNNFSITDRTVSAVESLPTGSQGTPRTIILPPDVRTGKQPFTIDLSTLPIGLWNLSVFMTNCAGSRVLGAPSFRKF
jgi:hypothetical protein